MRKNADIWVVTYIMKRGLGTIKGEEKCTVVKHDRKQVRNSVVHYEQLAHASMQGCCQPRCVYHHVNLLLKHPPASLKENTTHCQMLWSTMSGNLCWHVQAQVCVMFTVHLGVSQLFDLFYFFLTKLIPNHIQSLADPPATGTRKSNLDFVCVSMTTCKSCRISLRSFSKMLLAAAWLSLSWHEEQHDNWTQNQNSSAWLGFRGATPVVQRKLKESWRWDVMPFVIGALDMCPMTSSLVYEIQYRLTPMKQWVHHIRDLQCDPRLCGVKSAALIPPLLYYSLLALPFRCISCQRG